GTLDRPARGHVEEGDLAGAARIGPRAVLAAAAGLLEDPQVETPEAKRVVEVTEVRELVGKGGHEARLPAEPSRRRVPQANPDRAVAVADAVVADDPFALRVDRPLPEAEAGGQLRRQGAELLDRPPVLVGAPLPCARRRHGAPCDLLEARGARPPEP